jgi:hypothetical protein
MGWGGDKVVGPLYCVPDSPLVFYAGVRSGGWPPRSPDLNPVGFKIWGYMEIMHCSTVLRKLCRMQHATHAFEHASFLLKLLFYLPYVLFCFSLRPTCDKIGRFKRRATVSAFVTNAAGCVCPSLSAP